MSLPHASSLDRRRFWLLMLIALVVIGAGIGMRDPWPSDEPRYTLAARQMVEGGDWLFPHRGSELYADKPPMLMWAEAISFELVRNWRIAFLLPSLLAALGTLALVYDLGRRLWSRQVGLYAAAGLLLAFQFVYQVKRAQIDPLLMLLITAGNWGLLRHMLCGPHWRAYWLGCFCAGLGVITKGVGFLPLLLLLPYGFAARRGWDGVVRMGPGQALRWWLGLLAMLAAIALWLVPMLLAAGARDGNPAYAAYVQDILFHQTADRYANSWGHIHSPLYYIPIVLFSWLPLSLTYPGTLPRWWRALKAKDARLLLPVAWVALVLVFFSIPAGKRDVYILPALPMLALATAPFLEELLQARWLRAAGLGFIGLLGTLLLAVGAYALLAHPRFATDWATQREFDDGGRALFGWLTAIGASQLALVAGLRLRGAVWAVSGAMAVLWLGWSIGITPRLNDSSSSAALMAKVRAQLGPGDQLGLVAWKEQNLLMLDRPAVDFGFSQPWTRQYADAVAWQASDPAHRWLFVQQAAMGECVLRQRAVDLGHANRRQWWLFKAGAVVPGCLPDADAEAADARVGE
ncbi:ArnT family glycosyltransferase [Frateuria hangzhouensis]|uniref:ArnT family glycosyltransferase n=1 Tax=Frateuria hangzhouensis TaxID=2995589 RepID=UPI002260D384|nr:glycosyltransferase family 39 protein [Frateuria sp. STR12]MCX7513237.1 glycosyltransferase family 39 protein [Frateuria sp. STR12]